MKPFEWDERHHVPARDKKWIALQVQSRLGIPFAHAWRLTRLVFEQMALALARGERVQIRGFGVWYPKGHFRIHGRKKGAPPVRWVSFRSAHALRFAVDPQHERSTYYTRHLEEDRIRIQARRALGKRRRSVHPTGNGGA